MEAASEPAEHAAHRRLAEVDAPSRIGDVPLREQRVERDQQVQIQSVEVHALYRFSLTSLRRARLTSEQPCITSRNF